MAEFTLPRDLMYNRGLIEDHDAHPDARMKLAGSWVRACIEASWTR